MSIVNMKRLHMLAMEADRDRLFDRLQRLGCVEVSDQGDRLRDPEWAALFHPDSSLLDQQKDRLDTVAQAIAVLDRFAPVKTGLLTPLPQVSAGELFSDPSLDAALGCAEELTALNRELSETEAAIGREKSTMQTLEPWLSLDVPLNAVSTQSVCTAFGLLPVSVDLENVKKDLQLQADTATLYHASSDTESHYLFLMCHRSQEEAALEVLKHSGFSSTSFKGITGTAKETWDLHAAQLRQLEARQESLIESLTARGGDRERLELAYDRLSQEIQKEESKERLLSMDQTFFLEGWVTEPEVPALEELLSGFDCAYELLTPSEEEYPEVPVKLKSGPLTQPLEAVTEMYSLPAYGSLDPNPLMAPFFIFFFGMMMADMAYGLLMFFGCMFYVKKKRPRGTTLYMMKLFQYCGVTAFLFGALTGGFFGDLIPQLVKIVSGREIALPHLFSPVDDAVQVLVGSLALGLIQIFTGMGINMYKQCKRGQVMAALCGEGAWFVVFILIAAAVLTKAYTPCIIAILVVLVLTQGYGAKGIGGKLAAIGGSLYNNITGYFSDILSYSRLMALMLSGAVIAQVFNTLGALTGNPVLFFIIAMIGNALNFALNLLSCYVHDLRLQCLEFFGRFYEDGGKPFEPVSIQTKYVDIIE